MSVDSIRRQPAVGEPNVLVRFTPAGTPVGTESRWYLAYAPVNSKLPTLETVPPAERQKARLKVEDDQAQFTPDVPGHYQVEHHDVTVTVTHRTWNGAPEVAPTDNDFAGAPVVDLSSGDGPQCYQGQTNYQAVQAVSRTIGVTPNTLTFTVRVRDDVESLLPDSVKITPAATQFAAAAQYDDSILGVADLMREGRVRNNMAPYSVDPPAALLQVTLGRGLLFALQRWMVHINETTVRTVHLSADATNTVPTATVTTLAAALVRLAALRAAYTAHVSSAVFHVVSDTRNRFPTALPNPTDLASGIAFARIAFQTIVHGPNETTEIRQDNPGITLFGHFILGDHVGGNINDPEGATSFDFSSSLAGLLRATNELTRLYEAHRVRTTQPAAHTAVDSENQILSFGQITSSGAFVVPTIDTAAAVSLVNQLAECIERHSADQMRDGSIRGAALHQKTRPVKVGSRAGDLASALSTLELCCAAMEAHALDGGSTFAAHKSKVWGGDPGNYYFYSGTMPASWPLMTRAQGHLRRFQSNASPAIPTNFNTLPVQLLALGWRLPVRELVANNRARCPGHQWATARVSDLSSEERRRSSPIVIPEATRCRTESRCRPRKRWQTRRAKSLRPDRTG